MLSKKIKFRMATFFCLMGVAIFFIILRLFQVQVIQYSNLSQKASRQHQRVVNLQPKRGAIYDRRMRELAVSVSMYSIYAEPRNIKNPMEAAEILSEILEIDSKKVMETLTSDKGFVWLARRVELEKSKKIKGLDIKGIGIIEENKRFYPKKELCAQTIGFVGLDSDGLENKGLEGIEFYYDKYIKGNPGWIITEKDARGRNITGNAGSIIPSSEGNSIVLTIDEVIQHITERELEKGIEKYNPNWGMAIVMDPKTFEILALANWPSYNPNNFSEYPSSFRRNRAVTDLFEPGSTFKVAVASGLIEDGIVAPMDEIDCEHGVYFVFNHAVHDSHVYDTLTFKRAIAVSSNIAIIKSVQNWSPKKLYQYLCSFGYGEKTGIDLPGEVPGGIPSPDRWSKLSVGAIPIGQEVSVTGLQLIQPVATIANKGILMKPYIVKSIIDKNGVVKEFKPKPIRRVISEETAEKMTDILEGVVQNGTGKRTYMTSYRVAGKTGTAKKFDFELKKYSSDKLLISFVGFAPVKDPKLCVLVVSDEPKSDSTAIWGETICVPIAREIFRESLRYLNIPQETKDIVLKDQELDPDFMDEKLANVSKILEENKEKMNSASQDTVMPKLLGLTMKEAMNVMSAYQIKIKFQGSGIVVKQEPQPGSLIKKFQEGTLYFGDKT
ncbi:MAG: penicillin-binding transpeptidase domain-containing protein [bacterium]|nr:penicillin-binding transpeptidase domain-containing protein [bacterium]